MKKYLSILILLLSISMQAQKLSSSFDVKQYAQDQTALVKSSLNLDQATSDLVYKAFLGKAHSIQKYILLKEINNEVNGQPLEQIIKSVEKDAERGSGFQVRMKGILKDKYDDFLNM